MEWSERNSFGGKWRRNKARTVVDQENESDSDADIDDANAGVIWLPEDEEFDSVDNIGNNGGKMTTMKWGKMMTTKEIKMGHVGGRRVMMIVTQAVVLKI